MCVRDISGIKIMMGVPVLGLNSAEVASACTTINRQ